MVLAKGQLQLALPAVWSQARQRGFTVSDLVNWMCRRPAHLVGLAGRKGAIAPGYDADLVVFDPETFRDRATFEKFP